MTQTQTQTTTKNQNTEMDQMDQMDEQIRKNRIHADHEGDRYIEWRRTSGDSEEYVQLCVAERPLFASCLDRDSLYMLQHTTDRRTGEGPRDLSGDVVFTDLDGEVLDSSDFGSCVLALRADVPTEILDEIEDNASGNWERMSA